MGLDVYVYGMSVLSTIHRLTHALPAGDGYGEIADTFVCPGGEAMNAAMLLSGLGLRTALGGPHWGRETVGVLARYAERYAIDVTGIVRDERFLGVRDVVLVDVTQRTVLGWFGQFFSDSVRHWSEPDEAAIAQAKVIAIDPYFRDSSELAAQFATRAGKPYVTIDCAYDSPLHANAAANVISREFRSQHYPSLPDEDLFAQYTAHSRGLTIFTAGKGAIRYARPGDSGTFTPFIVEAKSTLGAGDTFRAGIVYGIWRGWSDLECVRFASGLAALLYTQLPIGDHVPTLAEVEAFLAAHTTA